MANKPQRPSIGVPTPGTMGAFARPPSTGSAVLDGIMSETGAHRVVPAPEPQPAAPEPPPAPAADERPAEPEPSRPVSRSTTSRRATGRARAKTGYPGVPDMPASFGESRKPLQVYLPPGEHWALKQQTFARGRDMSQVVAALVTIFNNDPDRVLALMDIADDNRQSLGELLAPALKAAEATA